jgi:hypothetical protein
MAEHGGSAPTTLGSLHPPARMRPKKISLPFTTRSSTPRGRIDHPVRVDPQLTDSDAWLMRHRHEALWLALALASFVIVCWIVIQTNGSFPGDAGLAGWIKHPHPPWPLKIGADIFAALANPIVACLTVAGAWVIVDQNVGPRYGILVIATVGAVALNSLLKTILGPTPLQISTHGAFAESNHPCVMLL